MAVRLRLRRIGKKKQPQYRLVAAEAAMPRDGRFIEVLGHYNPRVDPPAVSVNEERALWWLRHGAQPTETAKSLLVRTGVWETFTGEPAPVRPSAAQEVAEEQTTAAAEEAAPAEVGEEAAPVEAAEEAAPVEAAEEAAPVEAAEEAGAPEEEEKSSDASAAESEAEETGVPSSGAGEEVKAEEKTE